VCASFKRKNYFYLLSVLQTNKSKVWKETDLYTDGARWYIDACKWLRLKHIVYGIELKNIMERFIQQIKDRTENASMIISPVSKMDTICSMFGIG
jgi:transposase-like protein